MLGPCGQVPCSSGNRVDRVIWKSAIPAGQIFAIVVGQPRMLTVTRFREARSVDMVVPIPLVFLGCERPGGPALPDVYKSKLKNWIRK